MGGNALGGIGSGGNAFGGNGLGGNGFGGNGSDLAQLPRYMLARGLETVATGEREALGKRAGGAAGLDLNTPQPIEGLDL